MMKATDSGRRYKHTIDMEVIYEDNHLIIVNKAVGEIVQGDKTGDTPLSETVKQYLKEKYNKPGNVFCGVTHRIDRPVEGLVVLAKTSKALERMNRMFRDGEVHKIYHAIVEGHPDKEDAILENYLVSDGRINKTFVTDSDNKDGKLSKLHYHVIERFDRYTLIEIELITGRKHQIRAQLAATGHPIKGGLKYGAGRSNRNGGISLQSHRIRFTHPVSKKEIDISLPNEPSL